MAGASLDDFFARYVRGVEELPYNEFLSAAGLRLDNGEGTPAKAFLGADLEDSGEFINVKSARAGSPAYEQGLNAKDRIIALDGARVDTETFVALIAAKRPSHTVRVSVVRNADLRHLTITLVG